MSGSAPAGPVRFTMNTIVVILSSLVGAVLSSVLACVPGLHVYNILGLAVIGVHTLAAHGTSVPGDILVPFAAGMIVGYSMLNTVPSVLLAAPDDSALFTVLPGQKYLMAGRGYEAVLITSAGGLIGLLLLVAVLGLLGPRFLPAAKAVFQPHTHWILWCVIAFMLRSVTYRQTVEMTPILSKTSSEMRFLRGLRIRERWPGGRGEEGYLFLNTASVL